MTKSARTRASLIPYPVIARRCRRRPRSGEPGSLGITPAHIAALSTRTSYGPDGYPRPQVDEESARSGWKQS